MNIIDLYCGLGGWANGLIDSGHNVIGYDIIDFSKIQILIDKENFVNNSIKNYNVRAYIVVVLKLLKILIVSKKN